MEKLENKTQKISRNQDALLRDISDYLLGCPAGAVTLTGTSVSAGDRF